MQVKMTAQSETEVLLVIITGSDELGVIKDHVLNQLRASIKLSGFREGKAPLAMVEKNVDPIQLQSQFLEEAINQFYPQAVNSEKLRPVDRPEISVKKFVPFSTLEFEAKIPVLGPVKLPDYTKMKKPRPIVSVTAKDVDEVLGSIRLRMSDKADVTRAAKNGDEVWIDFKGTDAKGQSVKGAEGTNYPVMLGSNTFIPGFEANLIGLKANESKKFTLVFPKDYAVKALANKKVTFEVNVTKVQELAEPPLDDTFAAKAGPFKTVKELKEDIKKQLAGERQKQLQNDYESGLIRDIMAKSTVSIPAVLINDQVERLDQELRQNLTYRGQTYPEFLDTEGKTESQYRQDVLVPQAEERVKASLILAEIAQKEGLEVTPEELEVRMQILKGQYTDAAMQAELDKPEARRDIASRLLSEKTIAKVVGYATKK